MIGFIGVVASILIVLFFALFGCAACCCMCCFVPFYYLWKGNNGDTDAGKRENQTPQNTYQTVELREVHSASAPVWPEDVVADAYFVPPLVVNPVVHAVEYDNSCASQESYADHGSRVKDLWAAVVFILQTICVSSIAVYSWPYVIDKNSFDSNNSFNMRSVSLLLLAGIVLVFFSLAFAIMWINCLIKNSEFAIRTMLWVNIVVLTGASIVCLLTTQIVGVVIFGVMSILVYCFMQSVQDRIAFASSVLMVASQSVKSNNKGILALASGVAICEIFWSCIWVTAFSGVVSFFRSDLQGEEQDSNSTIRCLVFFFLFVSFFWNLQVLQNIAHVTISGTVACWWFQPKRSAPVRGSLFRALTTSFGSICFGSLIVATIQALRELRHFMREQHGVSRNRSNSNGGGANLVDCLLLVLDTVLQIIERAAVYFNRYAYCYVAAYGYDFITAGRKVTELFERRAISTVVNDSLISRTLSISVLAFCVCTSVFGAIGTAAINEAFRIDTTLQIFESLALGSVVGAAVGFSVGAIATNSIDSAVASVYVCFAEDPHILKDNHPDDYFLLQCTWSDTYPETTAWLQRTYPHDMEIGDYRHQTLPVAAPYTQKENATIPTTSLANLSYHNNQGVKIRNNPGEHRFEDYR